MRNQNVLLGQGKKCPGSLSLQVVNYTLGDVLNVKRALSQVGVIDFVQGLRVPRGDFLENPFHIAKIGLQLPKNFVN